MQDKQKINCTVEICKFNNIDESECTLKQIIVTPCDDCYTEKADESMCSSYEHEE